MSRLIIYLGYGLLAAFVFRYVRHGYWRRYPLFSAYILFLVLRLIGMEIVERTLDYGSYVDFYWISKGAITFARLTVVWEVLREVFPAGHPGRAMTIRASLLLFLGLAVFVGLTGVSGEPTNSRAAEPYTDVERKASLLCAAWVALVVGMGLWKCASFSRPVWAIAMGAGIMSTTDLANTAAFGLFPSFESAWATVRMYLFSVLMTVWLWGFWKPASSAEPALASDADPQMLSFWRVQWRKVRTVLGVAKGWSATEETSGARKNQHGR